MKFNDFPKGQIITIDFVMHPLGSATDSGRSMSAKIIEAGDAGITFEATVEGKERIAFVPWSSVRMIHKDK